MTDSFDEMRKIIKDLKSYRQDDLQIEKNLTNSNVSENENLSASCNCHLKTGCERIIKNYETLCLETGNSESLCMKSITSEMVVNKVKRILESQ